MRGRYKVIIAAGFVSVFCGTSIARADGAQLDRFDIAEHGSRFFAADSLELERPGQWLVPTAGVVTTVAHGLRVFGTPAEGARTSLVTDEVVLHPGAALVMAPGARFGVDVPLYLQGGHDENLAGQFLPAPRSPVLGDVRLAFDLRLLGPPRSDVDGLTVAGGVAVYLPSGSRDDYTSDGYTRVGIRTSAALRQGPILAAARVGLEYRRDLDDFGGVRMGPEANGAVGVGLRLVGDRLVVGPEIAGSTILRNQPFGHRTTPAEALLGAHGTFGDLRAGLGIGTAIERGLGAPRVRVLAAIEWSPTAGPSDRDRDGVPDADDACPDVAGSASGPPEARGCPEPPRDADRDGIPDHEDACPDLPGIRTRDPMTNGCPDADRDGVPDPVDACPSVSGERSPVPRFNGCPADADGDDVPDAIDACPDEPGIATDDPRTTGCPPPKPPPSDRDKDGIVDDADACPDEAGIETHEPMTNGCPWVRRDGNLLALAKPIIVTDTGIAPESAQVMTELASWLKAHPEAKRVNVDAWVDASTDPKKALRLSQKNAQRVVDALVAAGIAKNRLVATGSGAAVPESPKPRVDLVLMK